MESTARAKAMVKAMIPGKGRVRCPNPDCGAEFECDVCLASHLSSKYGVAFSDAFGGDMRLALVDVCDKHAALAH
ncbi:MAG: hypothetical protein ACT4PT_14155 [Methanobacteriota archaeon]